MKWICLECKKIVPSEIIEKDWCCPHCDCTLFGVTLDKENDIEKLHKFGGKNNENIHG